MGEASASDRLICVARLGRWVPHLDSPAPRDTIGPGPATRTFEDISEFDRVVGYLRGRVRWCRMRGARASAVAVAAPFQTALSASARGALSGCGNDGTGTRGSCAHHARNLAFRRHRWSKLCVLWCDLRGRAHDLSRNGDGHCEPLENRTRSSEGMAHCNRQFCLRQHIEERSRSTRGNAMQGHNRGTRLGSAHMISHRGRPHDSARACLQYRHATLPDTWTAWTPSATFHMFQSPDGKVVFPWPLCVTRQQQQHSGSS